MLAPKVFTNAKRYSKAGIEENITFKDDDNLLIKGNNLIALSSILKRYEGKVKCIYIDPPYNTGNDSFNYNDSFNHSTWLTFMKNRLELAKRLLREDGAICIHCDLNELAYLKVLCDEIYIRENFLSLITCKVKAPSGVAAGAQAVFDCSEYILIYSKNKNEVTYNHISEDVEIVNEFSKTKNFYKYVLEYIDYSKKEFVTNIEQGKLYKVSKEFYKISNMKSFTSLDFYEQCDKIFRTAVLSGGNEKKVKEYLDTVTDSKEYIYIYEHTPLKGKFSGILCEDLIYKKEGVLMLKNFVTKDHQKKQLKKIQHITSLFINDWWQGISSEGNTLLKNGKKPEILIKTLFDIFAQNENDIVLDFFNGSGTTCAVAHKMNRRWIGIEQMDYIELSKNRLISVVNGEQSGISKSVNWQGGGSFVYCELKEDANTLIDNIKTATSDNINDIKKSIYSDSRIIPYVNSNDLLKIDNDFEILSLEEKKAVLIGLINKNKLYVNYTDIDDKTYEVKATDKAFTKSFYEEV